MPPKERIKRRINEFDVFMNPEYWGQDCDSSAETFAGWAPEEEASRRFNRSDTRLFLDKIEQDSSCVEVRVLADPSRPTETTHLRSISHGTVILLLLKRTRIDQFLY